MGKKTNKRKIRKNKENKKVEIEKWNKIKPRKRCCNRASHQKENLFIFLFKTNLFLSTYQVFIKFLRFDIDARSAGGIALLFIWIVSGCCGVCHTLNIITPILWVWNALFIVLWLGVEQFDRDTTVDFILELQGGRGHTLKSFDQTGWLAGQSNTYNVHFEAVLVL